MYTLLRVENDRRAVCKINIKIIFGISIHCTWTTIINCYIDIYIYNTYVYTIYTYRIDVQGPTFFTRRTRIQDL